MNIMLLLHHGWFGATRQSRWSLSRRLLRDTNGTALVLVGLAFTALTGITALGVETGLWYAIKRQDQSAADAAAISGAYERATGQTYSQICGQVKHDAATNGFAFQSYSCPSSSPACTSPSSGQMCANNPPVLGSNAGDDKAVEVILNRQQNTYLAKLFLSNVTIGTRAVAKVNLAGIACAGALSTSAAKAVNFSGSSTADFSGCGIFSNSNASNAINFQGNTNFTSSWFQTVGDYNANGNSLNLSVPTRLTNSSTVTDPYSCNPPAIGCAGTITFTLPAAPTAQTFSTGGTLQPGLYASSSNKAPMDFTNSNTTYLCPGVYYLDGDANSNGAAFEVHSGATVNLWQSGNPGSCPSSGSIDGVTIIATSRTGNSGGGFDIDSGAVVNLSAPTSSPATGIPSGILFYQDPSHYDNKGNSTITASSASDITKGTLYTPKTNVTFQGNANSTCFIMIALTLTFSGNSTVSGNSSACSTAGVTGPTVVNIALTE